MGLSIMEVESKYVKFPSFSVCLDLDVKRDKLDFKEMRPLNETFSFLSYVRHFNNGYSKTQKKLLLNNYFSWFFWTSGQIFLFKFGI